MDCKNMLLLMVPVIMAVFVVNIEGFNKKVVIHVPYKVKKVNHVHTIIKTIHHHHTHRQPQIEYSLSPSEEHEHFHHLHLQKVAATGQHNSQTDHGIGIPEFLPEFLPDVDIDLPLKIPDIPHVVPTLSIGRNIPLYRRKY